MHGKLCNPEKLPPRLQAPPVLARRQAEVLGAVAAEIAQRAEVHLVGDHHIAVGGTAVAHHRVEAFANDAGAAIGCLNRKHR